MMKHEWIDSEGLFGLKGRNSGCLHSITARKVYS